MQLSDCPPTLFFPSFAKFKDSDAGEQIAPLEVIRRPECDGCLTMSGLGFAQLLEALEAALTTE